MNSAVVGRWEHFSVRRLCVHGLCVRRLRVRRLGVCGRLALTPSARGGENVMTAPAQTGAGGFLVAL